MFLERLASCRITSQKLQNQIKDPIPSWFHFDTFNTKTAKKDEFSMLAKFYLYPSRFDSQLNHESMKITFESQWCKISVFVRQAFGLPFDVGTGALPSAAVKISIGTKSATTRMAVSSANPVWEEILQFPSMEFPGRRELGLNVRLHVLNSHSEIIAECSIPFQDLRHLENSDWVELNLTKSPPIPIFGSPKILLGAQVEIKNPNVEESPQSSTFYSIPPTPSSCILDQQEFKFTETVSEFAFGISFWGLRSPFGASLSKASLVKGIAFRENSKKTNEMQAHPISSSSRNPTSITMKQNCHTFILETDQSGLVQAFVEIGVLEQEPGGRKKLTGIGYLHLNPFLPLNDENIRKKIQDSFSLSTEKISDFLFPGKSQKLRSSKKEKVISIMDSSGLVLVSEGTSQTEPNAQVVLEGQYISLADSQTKMKFVEDENSRELLNEIEELSVPFELEPEECNVLQDSMESVLTSEGLPYVNVPIYRWGTVGSNYDVVAYLKAVVDTQKVKSPSLRSNVKLETEANIEKTINSMGYRDRVYKLQIWPSHAILFFSLPAKHSPLWLLPSTKNLVQRLFHSSLASGTPSSEAFKSKTYRLCAFVGASDDLKAFSSQILSKDGVLAFSDDLVDIKINLPDHSILVLKVEQLSEDNSTWISIAESAIDLEDRVANKSYVNHKFYGKTPLSNSNGWESWNETRPLWRPGHHGARQIGSIQLCVDIVPEEINIPRPFIPSCRRSAVELRVVVWSLSLVGTSSKNIYIRGMLPSDSLAGFDDRSTEVYNGSKNKERSLQINWRFVSHIEWPQKDSIVRLQVWRSQRFYSDECIGEISFRVGNLLKKGSEKEEAIHSPVRIHELYSPGSRRALQHLLEVEWLWSKRTQQRSNVA
eukprot:GHVP01041423.1.p1 GENE.GHVP01041423.1~~GHVP01041423.1.p1  ORF type:complete len:880 (-),score=177.80 GHVP01041423.1:122-2761(-)